MKHLLRLSALLLAVILLLLPLSACTGGRGKALMTLDYDGVKVSLSVNHYRFLLSRLKGSMIAGQVTNRAGPPSSDGFWETQELFDGSETPQTWDEYYRAQVLDTCRIYLVGLWFFEKNNLSLSATAKENIQSTLDHILDTYGNGSKAKLNAFLAPYGVNYQLLKTFYETEAKLETVQDALYGSNAANLGTTVQDAYLNEHYLHFRQILFAKYDFVYVKDANGDEVYYDPETGNILYDENGYTRRDGNGNLITDENGNAVYFVTPTSDRIFYDVDGGIRHPEYDENGQEGRSYYTDAKDLRRVREDAEEMFASVQNASNTEFEAEAVLQNGETAHTDGYYLLRDTDYASISETYAYLSKISKELTLMEIGETALLETSEGWHIIRRYAPTSEAYAMPENEDWFGTTFTNGLMAELFLKECETYRPMIEVHASVLEQAPVLADVEPETFDLFY